MRASSVSCSPASPMCTVTHAPHLQSLQAPLTKAKAVILGQALSLKATNSKMEPTCSPILN